MMTYRMKIIIRTDMEGISGVFCWEQVTKKSAAYEAGRKKLTEDINAAVEFAEKAAMMPCLKREALYTVSYRAGSAIEVRKAMMAAIALAKN
jgi:D-aminopeptidase